MKIYHKYAVKLNTYTCIQISVTTLNSLLFSEHFLHDVV